MFDERIYRKLIEKDPISRQAYDYARTIYRSGSIRVDAILKITKGIIKITRNTVSLFGKFIFYSIFIF